MSWQLVAAEHACMGLPMPEVRDVLETLQDFRTAQQERVQQYVKFNHGFSDFLNSRQEGPYRCACSNKTFGMSMHAPHLVYPVGVCACIPLHPWTTRMAPGLPRT